MRDETPELEEANKLYKEQLDTIKKITEDSVKFERSLGNQVAFLEERSRIFEKEKEFLDEQVTTMSELEAVAGETLVYKRQGLEMEIESLRLRAAAEEVSSEDKKAHEEAIKELKKKRDFIFGIQEIANDQNVTDEAAFEILKKQTGEMRRQNAEQIRAAKLGKKTGDSIFNQADAWLGIGNSWRDAGLVGGLVSAADGADGFSNIIEDLKGRFEGLSPEIILNNMSSTALVGTIKKISAATINLAGAQDKSIANFRLLTGLGKEYDDVIIDSYHDTRALGMSTEEVQKSMGELAGTIAGFTRMTKESQLALTNLSLVMQQVGVDSGDMAAALDFNISALGMTTKEASKTAREVTSLALDLGVAPQRMGQEYAQLAPKLAAWGKGATKVFKEVAAASKALSIESSQLLGIVEQFDTFESAASSVGQLNAVLGGAYFDTVEMVNASESERIRLMIEGVQASGKSFDSLGRYQQKAIAAAAGINDMAEANKLFGQGLGVYDEMQNMTDGTARSIAQLSDKARENMSLSEKWGAIMESLAISVRPVVDVLNYVAAALQWASTELGAMFPILAIGIPLFIKLTAAIKAAAAAQGVLAAISAAAKGPLGVASLTVGLVLASAGIASVFSKTSAAAEATGFQEGGIVEGPAGIDRVPAKLTAGEGILTVEAVERLGGSGAVAALNDMNSHLNQTAVENRAPTPHMHRGIAAMGAVVTGPAEGSRATAAAPPAPAAGPVTQKIINLTIDGRKIAKLILDNEEYGLEARLALRESSLS